MKPQPDAPPDATPEPTMAQVMAMFAEIARQNAEQMKRGLDVSQEQLKQTKKPSNRRVPLISFQNPQGQNFYPMPVLKCEVLLPYPQQPNDHAMTWEEVELMNRIELGAYTVHLVDGTAVGANVIGTRHPSTGVVTKMAFMGPHDDASGQMRTLYTIERKQLMPALTVTLREMLTQKGIRHDDVLTMAERERRCLLPATDADHLPVAVGE